MALIISWRLGFEWKRMRTYMIPLISQALTAVMQSRLCIFRNCNSTFVVLLVDEDENIHDSSYSQVFTTVMQNRLSASPIAHLPFSFLL